jgi:hypothetical protein
LYHAYSMQPTRRGFDYSTVLFFTLQGPLLMLERLWKRFTGRKVGGWIGMLWVYLVLLAGAQPMGEFIHRVFFILASYFLSS